MKKLYLGILSLAGIIIAVPACKKDSTSNTGDSQVLAYNSAMIATNQSLENFILKAQTYDATNFTGKTHDEAKAIVDAFTQAGDQFLADMNQVLANKRTTGSLKSGGMLKDGPPCTSYDLIPGNTGQIQVGLVKSVADLIAETKGEVASIEAKYQKGEIDENTYMSALNTLKQQQSTKAVNTGFGAIMGTGASILTGLIVGAGTLPAVVAVTGVGLVVGTGVTWYCNWSSGLKLKNGQDGTAWYMTTGKSKLGDPIPSTMMAAGCDLTVCIDGYAPVYIHNLSLPDKGHKLTLNVSPPVKLEDASLTGSTEVCRIDEVMTATSCDQVSFVTAVTDPLDPGPEQSVTVIATIIPSVEGCDISFSMYGTDGYTKSGTYPTDAQGNASFYIPGGAAGVVDHVTITTSNGKTYTVTYMF